MILSKRQFAIFESVEVEDSLLRSHLLHRSGARSSALQLCKLKRANPPSRSCETVRVCNRALDITVVVSWRLPSLSQHRFVGMPPKTSLRKDRAVAMVMTGQASPADAAETVGLLGSEEAGGGQSSSQVRSTPRCLSAPSLAKLFCGLWLWAVGGATQVLGDSARLGSAAGSAARLGGSTRLGSSSSAAAPLGSSARRLSSARRVGSAPPASAARGLGGAVFAPSAPIAPSAPSAPSAPRRRNSTFQIKNHYFPNNVCARSQYWAWGGRTAPHLRRGTPRPPRGMASTPQRSPPPQRPPGPKSLLIGRPRNRSLRHLRGAEPPTRRLQPILPRKPSRTAAARAEERCRGRGDRSAAEEAIEHSLVSAVPEQTLG